MRSKLDQVEKNVTDSLHVMLKDDRSFTYGRMREAMHKMHGLVDILLWEKKADGTKVQQDINVTVSEQGVTVKNASQ